MHAFAPVKLRYPRRDRSCAEAFGPETLGLLAGNLLSWRQGPGAIGGLLLHACWGEASALERRYHGVTTWSTAVILQGVLAICRSQKCPEWTQLADAMAAQLIWQQSPGGGFIHASAEFEPTYESSQSCPIHQMLPMLALMDYYSATPPGASVRPIIEEVLERHERWFAQYWWRRGNRWRGSLPNAGWCGVTNQDLVAVGALAQLAALTGNRKPLEQYGIPALEVFLGATYYHAKTGLFERGDKENFTERCSYFNVIAEMLELIFPIHPDPRIPETCQRITDVLLEAIYVDQRGDYQMAWGADDAATALTDRVVWQKSKMQISDYPDFLLTLHRYNREPENAARKQRIEGLERTLASYIFADGGLPTSLDPETTIFHLVPSCFALAKFWRFLVARNPAGVVWNEISPVPHLRRHQGDTVFETSPKHWKIEEEGKTLWRGIKSLPTGILRPDESLPNYDFSEEGEIDIDEELAP
jgi:hypothetical protein